MDNKQHRGFDKAYKCIPECYQKKFKTEACTELEWRPDTFKSKKNGTRRILEREEPKLIEIFRKYGVDYETGENIFYR